MASLTLQPEEIVARALAPMVGLVSRDASEQLVRYGALIHRWNKVHNLTGTRSVSEIALRHIADCVSVVSTVGEGDVLDMGTGAGLPGIVVAICRPAVQMVLLDASRKRTTFCLHAAGVLELTNVQGVHQRVEDHAQEAACSYDWVLARGYATLAQCWAGARPLLRPNGALLAMKGKHPGEELEELTKLGENARAEAVEVPGLDEDRHLVTVRQGPRAHSQNMHRPGGG